MRRAIAAVALVATTLLGLAAASQAGSGATLRPVATAPLTLRGAGFTPHERVQLTVYAARASAMRVVTDDRGRFLARLPFRVGGCTLWTARAVGQSADSALYRMPAANCRTGQTVTGTGIAGEVTRGPITPVCSAEQPCNAPAPNIGVTISQGGAVVASTTTGADGRFAAALPGGHYSIAVAGRATPHSADVGIGHVTRVDIRIDTGIR